MSSIHSLPCVPVQLHLTRGLWAVSPFEETFQLREREADPSASSEHELNMLDTTPASLRSTCQGKITLTFMLPSGNRRLETSVNSQHGCRILNTPL
ncbi:hypothetical protein EYF80_029775 [Liparis tanakae]|uniref:Uncharacterized protein n=1 Tax=Liparis tanakae TaxID=230148 RepID=A0A4Z2H2A2_9TELE|nr:hypothetical protein EYF80_029775 [Liparis tanakae]